MSLWLRIAFLCDWYCKYLASSGYWGVLASLLAATLPLCSFSASSNVCRISFLRLAVLLSHIQRFIARTFCDTTDCKLKIAPFIHSSIGPSVDFLWLLTNQLLLTMVMIRLVTSWPRPCHDWSPVDMIGHQLTMTMSWLVTCWPPPYHALLPVDWRSRTSGSWQLRRQKTHFHSDSRDSGNNRSL